MDLLAAIVPLDIDAGLAPDATVEIAPEVSSDAGADAIDGEAASDASVDDAAPVDAG